MIQHTTAEREEELHLLDALLNGDHAASSQFVSRYSKTIECSVRNVFQRRRHKAGEEDIRDMVSEIWVNLLENDKKPLRGFDPTREIQVATWISVLARNRTIDKLRTSHECAVSMSHRLATLNVPVNSPLAADCLEQEECKTLVNQALLRLRPRERHFLEDWYEGQLTPAQIARALGISVATVYSRKFKLLKKLSRILHRLNRQAAHPIH